MSPADMIKKFYEKVLPTQGVYCVTGINPTTGKTANKFSETIDGLIDLIEANKKAGNNTFVPPASFNGYSRKGDNAMYSRAFFVDLDVGEAKALEGKGYASKEDAIDSLNTFIAEVDLPPPVKVDSGRGIHAYWILDKDIPAKEWKAYAEKFKDLCMNSGLIIDPVVTADVARILRCPNTLNYKETPPIPTRVLDEELSVYSWDEFKAFLGEIEQTVEDILKSIPKGLSDDQKAMLKTDNFETLFSKVATCSLEGNGCSQIEYLLKYPNEVSYDQWLAGLSIAIKCDDGDEAIHKMSEDYHDYNYDRTIDKAKNSGIEGVRRCDWYLDHFPKQCEGCKVRGTINTPISLGKSLKIAVHVEHTEPSTGLVRQTQDTQALPKSLYPFVNGQNGGVYFLPATKIDKDGVGTSTEPVLVSRYDLYPVKRIYSRTDGECLLIRTDLPNDASREFLLPMKNVYSRDKLKEIMASNGVLFTPSDTGANLLMSYIVKWGQYLMDKDGAEIMRTQMGWTDKRDSFVIGNIEIPRVGENKSAPTSPLCRDIAKHLVPTGSFDLWKLSANKLNIVGLEMHVFTMLMGFASVLMDRTTTSGATVCLTGKSGNAKTGAMYSALSIWGNPKDLSINEGGSTGNGYIGRYLALHNLPYGIDEVGDIPGKELGALIHSISHGKAKIRMQSSVNAEREHELSASLLAIFTSNYSVIDILKVLKKAPSGELARIIEFEVRKPKPLEENPSLGRKIFNPFTQNFGWAGPAFIRALYEYADDELLEMLDKWIARFKTDFGDDTTHRFYENIICTVMVSGFIANRASIVNLDEADLERIYKVVVHEMITIKNDVVKINDVDYEAMIGDFINHNNANILAIKEHRVSMEPRGPLVIRAEVDTGKVYIVRSVFNKYLNESKVSSREFKFQMKSLGMEVEENKKRMNAGWKDALGVINTWTYVFDTDKFPNNPLMEVLSEA